MEEQLRANAELVRQVPREQLDTEIGFDEAGVRWLDGYIDRQREHGDPEVRERLPGTLGSYLGECIRLNFGGQWIRDPELGWKVKINDKLAVFPFNKVRKQLNSGDGESVLAFYNTIGPLLAAKPPVKPWWKFW